MEEQNEIEKEKEEIRKNFVEMINSLTWQEKIKLFFCGILGIISSLCRLFVYKIKEVIEKWKKSY